MNPISVRCNHCGAPLQVSDVTRYITCGHCQGELQVGHESGAWFTRVPGEISRTTRDMSGKLDLIAAQNEVARLDREWEMQQKNYMVYGKYGQQYAATSVSSAVAILVSAIAVIVAVVFLLITLRVHGGFGLLAVFPIVMIALAIGNALHHVHKARARANARRDYEHHRGALLGEIERMQGR